MHMRTCKMHMHMSMMNIGMHLERSVDLGFWTLKQLLNLSTNVTTLRIEQDARIRIEGKKQRKKNERARGAGATSTTAKSVESERTATGAARHGRHEAHTRDAYEAHATWRGHLR